MNNNLDPILNVDTTFARQAGADWKVDLFACYQCGKCSNGCPVTFAMDYLPHQLIRMLQLGLNGRGPSIQDDLGLCFLRNLLYPVS